MRELELGVGRQMAIDDGRDVHLLKQRRHDGQRPEVAGGARQHQTGPGDAHGGSIPQKPTGDGQARAAERGAVTW